MKPTPKQILGQKMTMLLTAAGMLLIGLPVSSCASYDDVVFTFYDDEIRASEDSGDSSIDGTELTICASGTYTLTGSCENGSIVIDKNVENVTLVLDDLELACSYSAPIICGKNAEVFIELEGDSLLIDGEDPADEDLNDAFEGAAIKVKSGASLTIGGDGALEIDASSCKNGIKGASLSTITVEGGELVIDAANSALACDHRLVITGGDFAITSEDDGLKSDPDADDEDSDGSIMISGGTFRIDTADDAIHGTSEVTITGGTFTISAGDDAIHSELVLNIGREGSSKGPDITIQDCVEGFEGAVVNLYSGSGSIISSDDGINAANSDLGNYDFELNISGGEWLVDAGGDGLDSNGDINISGGTTESYGASSGGGGDTAMDADGKITVTGGTVLTVDSSGITPAGTYVAFGGRGGGAKTRGEGALDTGTRSGRKQDMSANADNTERAERATESTNRSAAPQDGSAGTTAISVSKDSELDIRDASGRIVYETASIRNASSVMLASDALKEGETYTLYVDGKEAASAAAVTSNASSGSRGGGKGIQPGQQTARPEVSQPLNPVIPQAANPVISQTANPVTPQAAASGIPPVSFLDVSALDWFYDAVTWAVSSGVASGTSATLFSPEEPCTRAQIVTFLWKAAGSPACTSGLNPFLDVASDAYYHDAVMWALEQGITSGVNATTFQPDAVVTRSQTAALLYRAADSPAVTGICPFYDVTSGDYYASAVRWAVEQKITAGTSATLFSPEMDCTRSQIVSFLYRWKNPDAQTV